MPRYDLSTTTLTTLLDDPDAVAIVERAYPGLTSSPMVAFARRMNAEKAFELAAERVGADEAARLRRELDALE